VSFTDETFCTYIFDSASQLPAPDGNKHKF